ncbi:hypothetical protein FALCPG4_000500 [Fusarium falciforme]
MRGKVPSACERCRKQKLKNASLPRSKDGESTIHRRKPRPPVESQRPNGVGSVEREMGPLRRHLSLKEKDRSALKSLVRAQREPPTILLETLPGMQVPQSHLLKKYDLKMIKMDVDGVAKTDFRHSIIMKRPHPRRLRHLLS